MRIDLSERRMAACGPLALAVVTGLVSSALAQWNYNSIIKSPIAAIGKPALFFGKVIQSVPDTGETHYALRVNVTEYSAGRWTDTIYVDYWPEGRSTGILIAEGSLVSIRGTFAGTKSYMAVLGQQVDLPHVIACVIKVGTISMRFTEAACDSGQDADPSEAR